MTTRIRVTTLGDVTTPTGGGGGIFDQVKNWFTGTVANTANAPANVLAWIADVKSRGNVVTRYPYTDENGTKGDLAEKEASTDSSGNVVYNYYLAPEDVVNADRVTRGLSVLAPVIADVAAAGEATGKAVQATSKAILDAPRQAIADALGISPTIVTVVALSAAGLWLYNKVRKR